MSNKYWENEQPVTANTGRNVFRYFKTSGKLQVCNPNWIDNGGQEKQGKTVTLDISALRESPAALDIIKQIAAQ